MRKIRILWTDDEIEILKAHVLFLREKGYEVDTCTNGIDTVDLVRHNPYDLIFLDETMPGLSGLETLRLIKEVRSDIPVVMITGFGPPEYPAIEFKKFIHHRSAVPPPDGYLEKPINPNELLETIAAIFENRKPKGIQGELA